MLGHELWHQLGAAGPAILAEALIPAPVAALMAPRAAVNVPLALGRASAGAPLAIA